MMELLFDETENLQVRHVCLMTKKGRYDFSFVYSSLFFGKSMIISLQTGKMMILSSDDIEQDHYWSEKLNISDQDIPEVESFLLSVLETRELSPDQHY